MTNSDPFENYKIRSARDIETNKHYFSVVDICAVLLDSNYQSARNYWKWLKNKLHGCSLVVSINQLKFEAQDGKLRYTDVMDAEDILLLIQLFPSDKAEAFRVWIAKLVAEGQPVVECLSLAVQKAKDVVKAKVGDVIRTIKRREFDVLGDGKSYRKNFDMWARLWSLKNVSTRM